MSTTSTSGPATGCKYWAFISYSHQDNLATRGDGSGDHIPWANWLHEQLETYRVPDGYRDRSAATGEPMPERFFPAFRDEAELPTSHDLGGQIRDALHRSRFLIVIASPRSARSHYVNEEVRYFRQLGRGNRILTLIVDGEPNVRLRPKAGWTAADDCFCPALVHPLRDDGSVDEAALLPEEPIAADVRVKEAEPPREMRASERAQSDRQDLLDFMKLKLIAGLMGVGLDELVQRDKRRAEEELRRVRREASRTEFLFARHLISLKNFAQGHAHLSKALENDPENSAAIVFGLEEIRRVNRSALRQYIHEDVIHCAVFSPDGTQVLVLSDRMARLWDATSGQPLAEPLRHDDAVISAVFSADGMRILTASDDKTARLWDATSGQPLAGPLWHEGSVYSAVFSADGMRILTASGRTARLWDADSGQSIAEPLQHEGLVVSAMFSPDESRILTRIMSPGQCVQIWDAISGQKLSECFGHEAEGGFFTESAIFGPDGARILTASSEGFDSGIAQLWDVTSRKPTGKPLRHKGAVHSAVFSADGMRILTASDDKTARLWNAISGQPLAEPFRHEEQVQSAIFSPDGARILTTCGRTARLWDAASGQPIAESFRHADEVNSAVFSPDGARILTASGRTARLWDADSGQFLAEPLRHEGGGLSGVFSPDSTRILTASWDDTARLWDTTSGKSISKPFRHESYVSVVVFNSNGTRALTFSGEGLLVRLWNVVSGQPLAEYHNSEAVFSPDGMRILTASEDGTARLWDAVTGQSLCEPLRHEGAVKSAVFSADGMRILTASEDRTARLWDTATGQPLGEPLQHEDIVNSAVFSSDSMRILTASQDGTARLWDAATGQPLAAPLGHENAIWSAVFSPDGTRILTAESDKASRLWDAARGQPLGKPFRHKRLGDAAVFSPDSAWVLTTSGRTVQLWDAASGQPLGEPLRHEDDVNAAVFNPDGNRILISSDRTARLWDAVSGQPLGEPLRHEGTVKSAVFSADGMRILTFSEDRTARVWDAASSQLLVDDIACLRLLLELGGGRLHNRGQMEPVPIADIERLRRNFNTATETDRLLCWWWSDPFTRIIHPSSTITVSEFVRRRIREVLDWPDDKVKASALKDARAAFPHHPLVLLCLAEQGQHGDPAWLARHAVSRLLAEPHYLTPLQSRVTDADRAARAYELKEGLAEDCYLGARLLIRQNRPALARQVLARACKLAPENETYRQLERQCQQGNHGGSS